MYATVRRYVGVTQTDEVARRVAEGYIPLMSDVDGFLAHFWVDAGDGVMLSTSVFEDEAAAHAADARAADWVSENLSELLPIPAQITTGEVVAKRVKKLWLSSPSWGTLDT